MAKSSSGKKKPSPAPAIPAKPVPAAARPGPSLTGAPANSPAPLVVKLAEVNPNQVIEPIVSKLVKKVKTPKPAVAEPSSPLVSPAPSPALLPGEAANAVPFPASPRVARKPVTIQLAHPTPSVGAPAKKGRRSVAAKTGSGSDAAQTRPASPSIPVTTPSPRARKIVFIASEVTPLASTGGLGDVVSGLSKALRQRGHDARIIMPLYSTIDRQRYGINFSHSCCIHFGQGEEIWVGVYTAKLDGEVPIWFVDYERYFGRPWIYDGGDEDAFRFGLLSKAALQICKDDNFIPDVAHVHDWMTAPAAVFLKTWDNVLSPLSGTASVLTIHNIGYQGKFHSSVLGFYGFGGDYLTADKFEDFGAVNLLKAGIQYADMVTTVSPTYAQEIRGPVGGMGLDGFLNGRLDRVTGILNGVDLATWNPATDKYLPQKFSRDDLAGKAACKAEVQRRFGLEVNPRIPLFGVISRFAPQKGFDLLCGSLPQALRNMVMQMVALGTGEPFTENFFRWLSGAYPGKANAHIGFSQELAHLIEAGSDFFLMPSLYEPCGLNQMYSSLYGALPIVRATGGLDDTVENYSEAMGTGTGFKFWEISDRAVYFTIGWAVSTWFDRPHHYAAMQKAGMARDFSWNHSASQYEDVYERAISYRRG